MSNWQIIKAEIKRWGFYNWLFGLLVMLPVALVITPLKFAGLLVGIIEMGMLKVAFKIPVKKPANENV